MSPVLYTIVYTRSRPSVLVNLPVTTVMVATQGPMPLAKAHKVLEAAAEAQSVGRHTDLHAHLVLATDPFGDDNPWDLDRSDLEVAADEVSAGNDHALFPYTDQAEVAA